MNYRMILKILSRVMWIEALLMAPTMLTALYYGENALCFLFTALICVALAALMSFCKPGDSNLFARDGFVSVALSWVLLSLVGALPFVFSGEIPSYVDALFETVSGFTTTGASILPNVELMSRSLLLWRSLSQWIGGMGVLVFVMAVLPLSESHSMHIMRAEVPGPVVGKFVPRVRTSSAISYLIYIGLTVALIILLCLGDMPFFDSVVHALSTASTGGYGTRALSIGYYNSAYIDTVIGVFMLLFGINFGVFYLLLMRKYRAAFANSELRWYLGIAVFATVTIALNLRPIYGTVSHALRYSFFQVSSIMTTTGFATANYELWPAYSKAMLLILMFLGACSASTGGGIKISRFMILFRSAKGEITKMYSPRRVETVTMDGKVVDANTLRSTQVFFGLYICITFLATLIVSIDGFDLLTNFSAVVTCISNVGPGLGLVGPAGNYAMYSDLSKLLLSLCMLIGRLEIYPVLMLFSPSLWRRT